MRASTSASGAGAGVVLDNDLMAVFDEFADTARGQPDTVFMILRFLRNADQHVLPSLGTD